MTQTVERTPEVCVRKGLSKPSAFKQPKFGYCPADLEWTAVLRAGGVRDGNHHCDMYAGTRSGLGARRLPFCGDSSVAESSSTRSTSRATTKLIVLPHWPHQLIAQSPRARSQAACLRAACFGTGQIWTADGNKSKGTTDWYHCLTCLAERNCRHTGRSEVDYTEWRVNRPGLPTFYAGRLCWT